MLNVCHNSHEKAISVVPNTNFTLTVSDVHVLSLRGQGSHRQHVAFKSVANIASQPVLSGTYVAFHALDCINAFVSKDRYCCSTQIEKKMSTQHGNDRIPPCYVSSLAFS